MVCEKAPGVEIDFLNDGLKYFIDGDIVSTHGRTSRGADNGLGIASILTILSDNSLKHPEIEAIFTSSEEEDFSGAANLDGDILKARHILNLDHCVENEILSSSAGGITVTSTKKLNKIQNDDLKPFTITLSGLLGGHSGEDIHKGRGNSNILLFRFLKYIDMPFDINSINGGSFRLAIPRESSITIGIEDETQLLEKRDEFLEILKLEFPKVKDLDIKIEKTSANYYYNNQFNKEIIDFILLLPVDVVILSNFFDKMVDTSNNVGEIYIKNDNLVVISDIRASYDSQRSFVVDKITALSEILGFNYEVWGPYYSWVFKEDSPLRDLAQEVYEASFDNLKIVPIHARLECGFFAAKIKNADIISIGPNSWDFHSPDEAFSIKSLNKFYENLLTMLKRAKFKE